MRSVEFGHSGWVAVEPGKNYVFSAYVKADQPRVQIRLALREASDWRLAASRVFSAGEKWQRFEVSYKPKKEWLAPPWGWNW